MIPDEELEKKIAVVFAKLHINAPFLLGKGGEGWVYEYGNDVLKVYTRNSDIQYLQNIQMFQSVLSKHTFSFDIPKIFEVGEVNGVLYTVEKRLHGIPMDKKIIGMSTKDRQKLYRSYYDAIREVNAVMFPEAPYGQIIKTNESITSDSWTNFLIRILDQKVTKTGDTMRVAISDFDNKVTLLKSLIQRYLPSDQKSLVHCDYFINNVLVDDNLKISAVLDFSVHAAVGDPRLDIAGVLTWNGIDHNVNPEDYSFLYDIAKKDYGEEIIMYEDLYLLFSSFYFADMDDPSFSVKNLNNGILWSKYRDSK